MIHHSKKTWWYSYMVRAIPICPARCYMRLYAQTMMGGTLFFYRYNASRRLPYHLRYDCVLVEERQP